MVAAGMASTDPVQVDGRDVRPRDVLVAVLARQGGAPDDPGALERLRAHVVGTSNGARVEIDADLPLWQNPAWGTDSGTYSTGVPPSIAAQLLAGGQALRTGVGGPEVILPVEAFFAALATRGMHAEISVRRPLG
jgi:saccharopine dehydrogenase-like NADP-dependent oxidoreductase